jgi:hypothetical protein
MVAGSRKSVNGGTEQLRGVYIPLKCGGVMLELIINLPGSVTALCYGHCVYWAIDRCTFHKTNPQFNKVKINILPVLN